MDTIEIHEDCVIIDGTSFNKQETLAVFQRLAILEDKLGLILNQEAK